MTDFPGIELTPDDTRMRCNAGLMIRGEFFQCGLAEDHDGWSHMNKQAEAIWQ